MDPSPSSFQPLTQTIRNLLMKKIPDGELFHPLSMLQNANDGYHHQSAAKKPRSEYGDDFSVLSQTSLFSECVRSLGADVPSEFENTPIFKALTAKWVAQKEDAEFKYSPKWTTNIELLEALRPGIWAVNRQMFGVTEANLEAALTSVFGAHGFRVYNQVQIANTFWYGEKLHVTGIGASDQILCPKGVKLKFYNMRTDARFGETFTKLIYNPWVLSEIGINPEDCKKCVIVEIKRTKAPVAQVDLLQLLGYMKNTGIPRGILIGFRMPAGRFDPHNTTVAPLSVEVIPVELPG